MKAEEPTTILNDRHEIHNVFSSSCSTCQNKFDIFNYTCLAFPEGIPDVILSGNNKHEKPLPGQLNNIVYLESI